MTPIKISKKDGLPVNDSEDINPEEVTEVYAFSKNNQQIPSLDREFTPLKGKDDEK